MYYSFLAFQTINSIGWVEGLLTIGVLVTHSIGNFRVAWLKGVNIAQGVSFQQLMIKVFIFSSIHRLVLYIM